MSAPRAPAFSPSNLAVLDAAWRTYHTAYRSLYLHATFIERRYLRTQDQDTYTRQRQWFLSRMNAAIRAWVAACRRVLGPRVITEPVGHTASGMPQCFLVRVPKQGDMLPEERLFGRPPNDDGEGRGLKAQLRHAKRTAREHKAATRYYAYAKAKMVQALTMARYRLAQKQQALVARTQVPAGSDRYHSLSKRSYACHHLFTRAYASAQRWQAKLAGLGLVYDLDTLDTPVPELEPIDLEAVAYQPSRENLRVGDTYAQARIARALRGRTHPRKPRPWSASMERQREEERA